MTLNKQQMMKQIMIQANDCGDLCGAMSDWLMEIGEDTFPHLSEDDLMTFSADLVQATACLTRCRTTLNHRPPMP